jgi:hypothetical protein
LPQRVVEPFDVIGFAGQLADRVVLCSRNHTSVHHILICIKGRVSTVPLWNVSPQFPGAFATAISKVKANDLAALGVHRQLYPLLVRLVLYEARHFVGFDLKALNHDGSIR